MGMSRRCILAGTAAIATTGATSVVAAMPPAEPSELARALAAFLPLAKEYRHSCDLLREIEALREPLLNCCRDAEAGLKVVRGRAYEEELVAFIKAENAEPLQVPGPDRESTPAERVSAILGEMVERASAHAREAQETKPTVLAAKEEERNALDALTTRAECCRTQGPSPDGSRVSHADGGHRVPGGSWPGADPALVQADRTRRLPS